jgi:hypothetical protein
MRARRAARRWVSQVLNPSYALLSLHDYFWSFVIVLMPPSSLME